MKFVSFCHLIQYGSMSLKHQDCVEEKAKRRRKVAVFDIATHFTFGHPFLIIRIVIPRLLKGNLEGVKNDFQESRMT